MSKDHCTGFFENWVRWKKPSWKGFVLASLFIWEVFALSELCKEHDKKCSAHTFAKLLWKYKVVSGFLIWLVATIACWIKFPFKLFKRL